jgi:hypothetical protein
MCIDIELYRPNQSKTRLLLNTTYAIKNASRVEGCRKAFMSFHSISNKVIQRLNRLHETN